jgi:hypothetical protein
VFPEEAQQQNLQANAGGYTFRLGETIYVTAWLHGSVGDPNNVVAFQANEFAEVAAHEVGHAADISLPPFNQSVTVNYESYVKRDLHDLDFVIVNGVPTPRLPCAPTPGSTDVPPFQGVKDYRAQNQNGGYDDVCVGGVLDPAKWIGNFSNSTVLKTLEPGLWDPPQFAYAEAAAHMFGWSIAGNQGAKIMTDQVFANGADTVNSNGYFHCMRAWANAQLSGLSMPASPPNSPGAAFLGQPQNRNIGEFLALGNLV